MFLYQRPALKIQCSSSTFYLLEEIGGYMLECRGTLQVKVRHHTSHLNTGSTGSSGDTGGSGSSGSTGSSLVTLLSVSNRGKATW